ncbi:PilW family protein [Pseudoduganella sp. UC29_106]|uniref:PilW family protein n=1 Tax=Pseudoduganella sp. UC29_106 TaxID=3374553 RepID=UPI00375682CF
MRLSYTIRRARGFSLIELMVAVVVGMLAVIFATRLLVTSEQQKSAAVGGSDSMQNGMLAMFQINTDAAQAGWGINDALVNGCNTVMSDTDGFQLTQATRGGANITPLAPIVIQSNATRSDVISIYSGSAISGVGNVGVGAAYTGGSSITINVNTPFNFLQGDVLLVAPEPAGGNCSLAQLDATPTTNVLGFVNNASFRFNSGSLQGGNYQSGQARVFNLGQPQKLAFHTWSVTNGVLMLRATDLAGTARNPQSVIDNVVAIKAQYGFDTRLPAAVIADPRPQVTQWSATMVDADNDGLVGGASDYQRIAGIRLAVIARSSVAEKPDPTSGQCTATTAGLQVFAGAAPAGVAAVPVTVALDVANDPISWTCYRYRAFETIVPIRNSGWRP